MHGHSKHLSKEFEFEHISLTGKTSAMRSHSVVILLSLREQGKVDELWCRSVRRELCK